MVRKSPQQKKALSYARDRRNNYGENDKSSRKNIRRNKRAPHHANRHRHQQLLNDVIEGALRQRRKMGANPQVVDTRIRRVRKRMNKPV